MKPILAAALLALSACAHRPLVRDCGAVVGDHSSAQEFAWVQPCERRDYGGCLEVCRRSASKCEAAQAAFREEPHGQTDERVERLAKNLEESCR